MKKTIILLFILAITFQSFAQQDTSLTNERKIFIYSPKRGDAIFTKIKLDVNGKRIDMPLNSIAEFSVKGKEIIIQIMNEHAGIRNGETLKVSAKDRNYFVALRVMKGPFKESFEVAEVCEACYSEMAAKSKRKVLVE